MEESKDKQPSPQKASEGASKPVGPPQQPGATAGAEAPPPRPAAVPRPPASPPAAPRPAPPKDTGRRSFLKVLFVVGAILSIVPFVPWGNFLSSTVSGGTATRTLGQLVYIDDIPDKYGEAAGQKVNVNDIATFPPNNHWVVTYPTSGDHTIDSENPDTFQKYELIRLPEALGGANKKATDFVAFSKVCVHLWCSPNYNPTQDFDSKENQYTAPTSAQVTRLTQGAVPGQTSISVAAPANFEPSSEAPQPLVGVGVGTPNVELVRVNGFSNGQLQLRTGLLNSHSAGEEVVIGSHCQFECPCHGSTYEVPDGAAVAGPASLQPFPNNAIPMMTLQADSSGDLYIFYPNKDPSLTYPNDNVADPIEANGELGFGRDFQSYENFIKPRGAATGNKDVLDTAVS